MGRHVRSSEPLGRGASAETTIPSAATPHARCNRVPFRDHAADERAGNPPGECAERRNASNTCQVGRPAERPDSGEEEPSGEGADESTCLVMIAAVKMDLLKGCEGHGLERVRCLKPQEEGISSGSGELTHEDAPVVPGSDADPEKGVERRKGQGTQSDGR